MCACQTVASVCEHIYVITVGASLPVNLGNFEISNAIWMSGSSVWLADPSTFSFSYESMYNLKMKKKNAFCNALSVYWKRLLKWSYMKICNIFSILPNCCTRTACSTESYDNTAAVFKDNSQALYAKNSHFSNLNENFIILHDRNSDCEINSYLFRWNRFVDWIGVAKVVGEFRFVSFSAWWVFLSNEWWVRDCFFENGHHFIAWLKSAFFVIVTSKVVSSISGPVLLQNVLNTFAGVF